MAITSPSLVPKAVISKSKGVGNNSFSQSLQQQREVIKNKYVYQRNLLEEAVYTMMRTVSDKPLERRIDFSKLGGDLKSELLDNGIDIPFHFTVSTGYGREVYRCSDYDESGQEHSYTRELFPEDPPAKMGILKIHFPTMNDYIFSSVRFMIPSLIFMVVLLITFIFTIFIIFRQKKLTEIKNDFINNMTHEFKTPISTISRKSIDCVMYGINAPFISLNNLCCVEFAPSLITAMRYSFSCANNGFFIKTEYRTTLSSSLLYR
jgi:hypothetical protein